MPAVISLHPSPSRIPSLRKISTWTFPSLSTPFNWPRAPLPWTGPKRKPDPEGYMLTILGTIKIVFAAGGGCMAAIEDEDVYHEFIPCYRPAPILFLPLNVKGSLPHKPSAPYTIQSQLGFMTHSPTNYLLSCLPIDIYFTAPHRKMLYQELGNTFRESPYRLPTRK